MPAQSIVARIVAVSIAAAVVTLAGPHAQTPPQTVFRGGALVVPVDVRVLDRNGKPVTDLKADDFTILEDGVRQRIRHFSTHALTATTPEPNAPLRRTTPDAAITPLNRRVFLIALGRGRLKEVSKGLEALERFVRERLLPQDHVAVMAWNRATDFSTDHKKVVAVLERYRERHEAIESDMRFHFSGLMALYSPDIPKAIQAQIDDVFSGAAIPGTRQVLPGSTAAAEFDARRIADLLQTRAIANTNAAGIAAFGQTDQTLGSLLSDTSLGANFDDYVALSRQTMQDFGNLLAGVEYLRFVEGEKHLVFVTEHGFLMPSADYDRDLGALASDARVAIDTIQTGGVNSSGAGDQTNVSVQTGFALSALRTVAETSGGQHAVSTYADQALDRILSATEFGYVLGYTPTKPLTDGRFRKISVEVNRKGVQTSYRRGYFGREDPAKFDPRRLMAITRLNSASAFPEDINDLKLTVKATDIRDGAQRLISVETTIAANRIVFGLENGRHLAALSQVILCTDGEGRSEGGVSRTLDMRVPPNLLDQIRLTGLKTTVQVPVTKPPVFVKVIVYDYGSDLLGSTYIRMH
jgi:VWFA-related protein